MDSTLFNSIQLNSTLIPTTPPPLSPETNLIRQVHPFSGQGHSTGSSNPASRDIALRRKRLAADDDCGPSGGIVHRVGQRLKLGERLIEIEIEIEIETDSARLELFFS